MISFDEFDELVREELELLPNYVKRELNGGVLIDEKAYLHPARLADDLYIFGTYSDSYIFGKQIVLYYGSFMAFYACADRETVRRKVRETLRHEFRHHLETMAGEYGEGSLLDEDRQAMFRYLYNHNGDRSIN